MSTSLITCFVYLHPSPVFCIISGKVSQLILDHLEKINNNNKNQPSFSFSGLCKALVDHSL